MTTPASQELRGLIRSKLTDGMTPDQAADAVAALFHRVEDDWDHTDITTQSDLPDLVVLDQRWLVAHVPRESRERRVTLPNRTVSP